MSRYLRSVAIPIVMSGMLQAVEGTPLYTRVKAEGRLLDFQSGDQFNHSNIVPVKMSHAELYAGYRRLLSDLYDWRAYEERAVAFVLQRGERKRSGRSISERDRRALRGILGLFVGRHGLRRALFSWRVLLRVARHRPAAAREALSFILMHKAMYDYTQGLLDGLVAPEVVDGPARIATEAEAGGCSGSDTSDGSSGDEVVSVPVALTPRIPVGPRKG
jgi:hypothetical protein